MRQYSTTHNHILVDIYLSIYKHIHAYTRIYTHIHAYTRIYADIRAYTRGCTHIHAYTRGYAAYTCLYTPLRAFTRIYTHMHAYTRISPEAPLAPAVICADLQAANRLQINANHMICKLSFSKLFGTLICIDLHPANHCKSSLADLQKTL